MVFIALMLQATESPHDFSKWDIKSFGIRFYLVDSITAAKRFSSNLSVDLLLIDGESQENRGLSALKSFAEDNITLAVIVNAADIEFQIAALENGASDILLWSSPMRLQALKLRQLLKNKATPINDLYQVIRIGDLTLDPRLSQATYRNSLLQFPINQFKLLYLLAQNLGVFVPRQALADGLRLGTTNRGIDMAVSRIRACLKQYFVDDLSIETAYGLGYRLSRLAKQNIVTPPAHQR